MGRRRLIATAVLLALSVSAPDAHAQGGSDIVGGSPTTVEEWPWQIGVAEPPSSGGNGFQRQFCGGTLVSPTAVVTAAHCAFDSGFVDPSTLSAITGRTNLSSNEGAELPVSDVIYFVDTGGSATPQSSQVAAAGPQLYDEETSEWDVVVLELASPAPAPAAPVAVASPAERDLWEPGDSVFATGWGDTTGAGISFPDDLREVQMEVISDSDCGDFISYGSEFVPSTMVCAGVPTVGGKDTCQGDSGGPLVAPAGDGTFRLIGDTSFGEGCALPEKPGVYGRLADDTIRPALLEAVALADGEPAPAVADTTAPQTRFSRHPGKRTKKRRASFTWTASEQASFACTLDRGAVKPCESPFSVRVKPGRRHTLEVVATDAAGNAESPPARFSWKVKRPRRR